jgi:SpoVK/Ycf46/Vps4 family AAA+-type ATPase
MSSLIDSQTEIEDLIRASYPLIYIVSPEEKRVEEAVLDIAGRRKRQVMAWSITDGFTSLLNAQDYGDIKDPLRALEFLVKYEDDCLFVLRDFHPYLQDPSVVRKLRDISREFKKASGHRTYRRTLLLLSPVLKPPVELEKEMAVVDFGLPGRDEIEQIVMELVRSAGNLPLKVKQDPDLLDQVVEAALGLTADEAGNVFAKSLVRTRDFDIDTILHEKKHIIRKSGILEFYETSQRFSDVGGLDILKDWLRKRQAAFAKKARDFGLPMPKGILLIGVPGCGKSLTAKAVGALWKMPLLRLDVGKVFSSLVGSSEENFRKAIMTAEAVAPSILWLDELEKGFSGTKSSGQSDAGTTARVFATFITWLQEKTSPVFVIATANDVSMLPPELLRKGRFDEIFFVDLPSPEERSTIATIHIDKKNRDAEEFDIEQIVASSQGFSGSELEQAIISALYDAFDSGGDIDTESVVASCQEIIPLSYTMKEGIDAMREWAKSRARRASSDEPASEEGPTPEMRGLEI